MKDSATFHYLSGLSHSKIVTTVVPTPTGNWERPGGNQFDISRNQVERVGGGINGRRYRVSALHCSRTVISDRGFRIVCNLPEPPNLRSVSTPMGQLLCGIESGVPEVSSSTEPASELGKLPHVAESAEVQPAAHKIWNPSLGAFHRDTRIEANA